MRAVTCDKGDSTITINGLDAGNRLLQGWVRNQGAACTSAAALAALAALGATNLPQLGPASIRLGASEEFGAPSLLDYVSWPGRRAPLDLRLEALARESGIAISSRSQAVLPGWPLRLRPHEMLLAHLVWGQEAPGRRGAWGWRPLAPKTYSTGGHTVVVAGIESGSWAVLDPNLSGIQNWPVPGIATAVTRIMPVS